MEFKPFKIGKYLLLERLAIGGMAEVYRAKASGAGGFEKQLAIKRILPNYSSNEEFRRMFEYEARLSSMLTHANIVQIYDFVKSGETYLLAMEYVNGKNLRQVVNKVKKLQYSLPIEFSIYVINEVCKGLEYAHQKKDDLAGKPLNIIHRDMSPQNIMLSYDGAVKIVDFGIAKAKDRVDETRSGVIKGKFGYMSPEQANGLSVDRRTDIFSTAIILYELLTGKRLFAADNDLATLKLIQECVIPKPSRVNPKISVELEKILMKGLSKDLNVRYSAAGIFHRQLQEYLNKYYPTFTQREAADILQRVFAVEIEAEKKRFEQIHRQSIPFSQGQSSPEPRSDELGEVESALDGSVTKSEQGLNTAITFVDEVSRPGSGSNAVVAQPTQAEGERPSATQSSVSQSVSEVAVSVPTVGQPSQASAAEATRVEDILGEPSFSPTFSTDQKSSSGLQILSHGTQATEVEIPASKGSLSGISIGGQSQPTITPSVASSPSATTQERMPTLNKKTDSQTGEASKPTDLGRLSSIYGQTSTGNPPPPSITQGDRALRELQTQSQVPGNTPSPVPDDLKLKLELTPPKPKSYRMEREEWSYRETKRRSSFWPFLLVLIALGGTIYLYRLLLNGGVPRLFGEQQGRDLSGSSTPNPPVNPMASTKPAAGVSCFLYVDSDPAGAKVFVNGEDKGTTSTTLMLPCRQSFNVEFRLDGYEPVEENVYLRDEKQKLFKSLRSTPLGRLELTLDQNAEILVDGESVGEATADKPYVLSLRAGVHKVRFRNQIFGIDTTQEFTVSEGLVTKQMVILTDRSQKRRP